MGWLLLLLRLEELLLDRTTRHRKGVRLHTCRGIFNMSLAQEGARLNPFR